MIRMNDFQAEPDELRRQELSAVERVLRSGSYVLGPEVEQFETAWAAQCGAAHAVGVGSGTDALEIGLRILGIGPGDEVITTSMSAFATTLAILRTGASPVFADMDPQTALLSLTSVERCLSKKTKAILLVHLYGQARELENWATFCAQAGIHLLEDCAQAHLASSGGKSAGALGVWGAYSFYPTKNLGTAGDAGALVTQSADLAEAARRLRNYGFSPSRHADQIGLNSRLDEIHAALLQVRLNWLNRFTEKRRWIAEAYQQHITNPMISQLALPLEVENHVYHLFVVLSDQRDRLRLFLRDRGIESSIHYPVPIHHQPLCRPFRRDPEGLKHTERHAETCLSIPCHPQMNNEDTRYVIEALNEFCV